jgi:small subunit ribosomal protein S6
MYILDSNHYARDPKGVSAGVGQMIEKCGGQVLVSRLWAEQKLAYPIDGHKKGTYWLTYFRLDSDRLRELNRAIRLNGDIVRDLVLVVDPRLVETLVEHASSSPQRTPTPDTRLSDDDEEEESEDDGEAESDDEVAKAGAGR